MQSTRLLGILVALFALAAVVFIVRPDLDLTVAALFVDGQGRFLGNTSLGLRARHLFELVPFLLLATFTALYALRRLGRVAIWAPNGSGLAVMYVSLAIGPGLLVNTLLKDHSHRPRPVQVEEFGGPDAFRPFYRFDGACGNNCSFVSGEGALAAWTLSAALITPAPYRGVAVAAALVFTATASALRMAFGGHFLSDTIFAILLTWTVIVVCWRSITRLSNATPGPYPRVGERFSEPAAEPQPRRPRAL